MVGVMGPCSDFVMEMNLDLMLAARCRKRLDLE